MRHTLLTAGLAAAGALLAAEPAAAQFYNPAAGIVARNNLIYGVNPYRGAISPYEFGYARSAGFNVYNPVTGGYTAFRYTQSQPFNSGVIDVGGTGLPSISYRRPLAVNPYLMTGQGGYTQVPNDIAAEQARRARQGAGAPNGVAPAVPPKAPNGVAGPGNGAAVPPPAAPPAPPVVSAEQVRSGEALNAVAADIAKLLEGGAKADAPLFPADLLAQIRYQPGPAADLIAALRDGKPELPAALNTPAFTQLRSELPALAEPVLNAVLAGKRPDPDAADKLIARTAKACKEAEPALKTAAAADADTVSRYFAALDAAASVGKNQDLAGVYSPAFASVGATAAELVKFDRAHDLKFAPAAADGDAAYLALHRGLTQYKQALESGK